MNLEPIIQSEVSHKEKDKYCILTHVYGIQKDGTDDTNRPASLGEFLKAKVLTSTITNS